jgi:hypothetical protein
MTELAHVSIADLKAAQARAADTNHTYSLEGLRDGSLASFDAKEMQKLTGQDIAELTLAERQNRLEELGGMAVAGDSSNPRDLPWWFDATKDPNNRTLWVRSEWKLRDAANAAGLFGWGAQLVDAELRWTYRQGERAGRRTYRKVADTRHIVIPDGVFGPEPVVTSTKSVKADYKLWTNEEMVELVEAIQDNEASKVDAVGHYGLGAHAFVATRLSDTRFTIPGLDDPGSLFIVTDTSYTGIEASRAYATYIRHRCRNTSLIGQSEAVSMVNIVHRGDMADKGRMAVDLIMESIGAFDAYATSMSKLAKVALTVREVERDIAPKLLPYTTGQVGKTSADPAKAGEQARRNIDRKRDRFLRTFAEGPTLDGLPHTAYRARQALSESAEHLSDTRTQRARLDKVTTPTGDVTRLLHEFDLLFPAETGAVRKPKREKATNVRTLY